MSKKRLGRGLDALLSDRNSNTESDPARTSDQPEAGRSDQVENVADKTLNEIPIADVQPSPFQPRRSFEPEALQDLEKALMIFKSLVFPEPLIALIKR